MSKRLVAVAGALAGAALTVAGCSSSGGSSATVQVGSKTVGATASVPGISVSASASVPTSASTSATVSVSASPATSSGSSGATTASQAFGPSCSKVPSTPSNPASFAAMAKQPVAKALGHNSELSTLITAITKAGLTDTLNHAQHLTLFAPNNDAFTHIGLSTAQKLLAQPSELKKVLTYHVVPKQLTLSQLEAGAKTQEGSKLMAKGTPPNVTVGPHGTEATVTCGNIKTANATVYIINRVLMPPH